jgi:hypothetical protein
MSSFEHKVAATTDFLRNRASLGRITNHQEVAAAVGEILHRRGQRSISTPVRREKIKAVLDQVDRNSWGEEGILLSALVPHFWDNQPGHGLRRRLRKWANGQSWDEAIEAVFEKFEADDTNSVYEVDFNAPRPQREESLRDRMLARDRVPDDVSELDTPTHVEGNRALTEERIRQIFREELEASQDSY